MQNKYPGKCDCGAKVEAGEGTLLRGKYRWIVVCADCSSPKLPVAPAPVLPKKGYFLNPTNDQAEWQAAWDAAVPGEDKEEFNPTCLESWQYMGTWLTPKGWVHEFRHRHHPTLDKRVYRQVPVTGEFARTLPERAFTV